MVKALASALCIGGGGSVGREGPIVQIGSALGSTLGQAGSASPDRACALLVACGAAGGISATFNAPLAGVVLRPRADPARLRGRGLRRRGAVRGDRLVVGRAVLGDDAFLSLPAFDVAPAVEYLLYAAPRAARRRRRRASSPASSTGRGRLRLRLVARAGVGAPGGRRPAARRCCCSPCPRCTASATRSSANAVEGRYAVGFLLVLLVGKMVATSLTIGIGGSGGVFAPVAVHRRDAGGDAFGQIAARLAARASTGRRAPTG